MSNEELLKIIKALADGVDPLTDEEFSPEHICQQGDVIRALNIVAMFFEGQIEKNRAKSARTLDEVLVDSGELVDALKHWRLAKAKELGWTPAYVLHDVVIFRLVTHEPSGLNQLIQINGIGRSKLERFGDELLKIIREHTGNTSSDQTACDSNELDEQTTGINHRKENECIDCGCEIHEERLKKIPGTLRCVDCQDLIEKSHPDSVKRTMKMEESLVGSRDDHNNMRGKIYGDIRRRNHEQS